MWEHMESEVFHCCGKKLVSIKIGSSYRTVLDVNLCLGGGVQGKSSSLLEQTGSFLTCRLVNFRHLFLGFRCHPEGIYKLRSLVFSVFIV